MLGGMQMGGETDDTTLHHRSSSSTSVEGSGRSYFDGELMMPGLVRTIPRNMTSRLRTPRRHWQLAWCNEDCFKAATARLRQMLLGVALEGGGSMVCHKKAKKFLEWLTRDEQTTPYVLLCVWREAKPCLEGLEHLVERQPLAICVHVETARSHERASEWAQTLPTNRVKIFDELRAPALKEFLATFCGINFDNVPGLEQRYSMTPELGLSDQEQFQSEGISPCHVGQRDGMETQAASNESAVAAMPSVQRLTVSELLRLLQEGGLQTDAIVSL
eukprot:TRINITY_DN7365_c0_g3_i1.p1 TRINITY_DN7365_c0_g3~~TRINITY_DN7365_c0_g3_i1.p1  ORF type:complete len:274 (-),score=36.61 TRINITY_DN7365_c0_g3_i1:66-887(-)